MIDFEMALGEYYIVERVTIGEKINSLAMRLQSDSVTDKLVNKYRAIIIAKPTQPFSDKDKFLIDQFIMRGGKTLWLLDPVFASMDSLEKYTSTISIVNDLKLDEMLFNYGVRLNNNLVMDLTALPIPIMTGSMGGQPQFEYFPWFYFPILTPTQKHPIVNGLDAIKTEFISTLDTVDKPGISKTILLTSSPYSRTVNVPALIDLEILRREPDQRLFQQGPQNVAVLLEGSFTSTYQHRIPPEIAENEDLGFREKGKPTKMVVIADGDIAKNQFHFKEGYPLPLGYDQYTRRTYGNKNLLLNAVNYLCDDSGLITVRSRELKLRLLDQAKVTDQRLFWQLINLLAPVLLIILFGIVKYRIRLARYAQKR
jgi:ABC-2 type transport system permease protein